MTPYSVKLATLLWSYEGIIVLAKDGEHIQAILDSDGCFPTCLCPLSITISCRILTVSPNCWSVQKPSSIPFRRPQHNPIPFLLTPSVSP
ncbi:uncharacterized protein ARMOST_07537 [Armillaria ostoyae]|uniref:Uncharacterized protein n=1 Tax=Armillaria ostoyae TaxID=47428 RepID=A0A284R635_ARMOS|nr:uncharacterized protein ARMOST_07537 [Armillaria ostoyae]